MFDQLSLQQTREPASGEALLAAVSVLLHAGGVAAILASSWLTMNPLPLPKLRPYLVAPVVFPAAGAPAPLKGLGAAPTEPARPEQLSRPPEDQSLSQPVDTLVQDPAPVPVEPSPSSQGADAGSPDGRSDGSDAGVPGGACVGENCDPEGPVGAGPGIPGGLGEADPEQEVLLPGIHDVTEPQIDPSSRVLPRYPEAARRAGVEGQVILQAVIQPDGSVGSLLVLRETPPRIGFGAAAMEAVSKWRYRPGLQRGRAVTVQVTITVQFTLSR